MRDEVAGPDGSALSEGLGAGAEARGCDNCGKRGPWQTEHGAGKNNAMTYELAECHHYPKPAWWRNAGPLWVAHGCGSGCQVWAPLEAPNDPDALVLNMVYALCGPAGGALLPADGA